MMRVNIGVREYWDIRIDKDVSWIDKALALLSAPSKNPAHDPQFTFDLARDIFRLAIRRYSRGDEVEELTQYFPGLLDAWELSNELTAEICHEHGLKTCRDWTFSLSDLNHYNWCFWLVGLALALKIPDDQWHRLLALIGGEGEDELLDKVIACRQSERGIGKGVIHSKPYARLLKAIDAPAGQRPVLLRDFVEHWYSELVRTGKQQLWWYDYGDPVKHPLEMGSYFGRWCIEAVAAVKAFGIDDSLCLDHPNYPGDLIEDSRCPRYPDTVPPLGSDFNKVEFGSPNTAKPSRHWLSRMLLGPGNHE